MMHLVNILIHEQLHRDLHDAETPNRKIEKLRTLVARKRLSETQLDAVLQELESKVIEVLTIRPAAELPENPFAGFVDRGVRESYLAAGQEAARAFVASRSL
jgi:hypothetical protein